MIDRGFVAADGIAALRARSIMGSLPGWLSCFASAIDRGVVAADGRDLVARS